MSLFYCDLEEGREGGRERVRERESLDVGWPPFNVKSKTLATPLLNTVMLYNTASPLMRSSDSAKVLRMYFSRRRRTLIVLSH